MADIYEARIEVLTEENENIRRMLRRLKDTLLYKEKEVESLRGLLKEREKLMTLDKIFSFFKKLNFLK